MTAHLLRRLAAAIPTTLGVVLLTFVLFFLVTNPDGIARQVLGAKAKPEAVKHWIEQKGLDKPYYFNPSAPGLHKVSDTLLFTHISELVTFSFGNSWEDEKPIINKLYARALPSILITLPAFILALFFSVSFSLLLAFFRGTYVDKMGTLFCVLGMAVMPMVYIIAIQALMAVAWKLAPVSGWADGFSFWRFAAMPVVISVLYSLGGGVRFYRTLMLEEISKDYVRTARAKGLTETAVLFGHVLRNAMIPILTVVVMEIPFLFMGALLLENFFGIPGLGSFTLDALYNNDFQTLKAITFIGSLLYQAAIILTDAAYAVADPRIRFDS